MTKNILTNQFKIMNCSTKVKSTYDNNDMTYKMFFDKDIDKSVWGTIGLHVVPNFLFKVYETLNQYLFNISFDYEFYSDFVNSINYIDNIDESNIIKIYNGMKWTEYSVSCSKGSFSQDMNFNFTKNYWRISIQKPQDYIFIKNLKISICEKEYVDFNNKKKILFIGGRLCMAKDFNIDDNKLIGTFVDNYCYYFQKYLINKYGYTTYVIPLGETDSTLTYLDGLINFDFCIDINQRGLLKKGVEFYEKLRQNIKYGIFNVSDNNDTHEFQYGPQKLLFYSIFNPKQINNDSFYIGWATNPEVFYPQQNLFSSLNKKITSNEITLNEIKSLTILIDDKYCRHDTSDKIIEKCFYYMLTNGNVKIYRFGYSDMTFNFVDKYKGKHDRYIVLENKMPQYEKAYYHNISDIFIVSHRETMGFEVLESAMSGCFIVCKNTYIKNELLADLLHFKYDDINELDLDIISKKLDINTQRQNALKYTWENSIDRLHNVLLSFYK